MRYLFLFLAVTFLWFAAPDTASAQAIAFPGCEGYGCETRHAFSLMPGTQPTICYVTNLNDSGTGSLRDALDGTCSSGGPFILVCGVSGYVNLTDRVHVIHPYSHSSLSSCPSPGLTYRYDFVLWRADGSNDAHDIVVKHFRARITDLNGGSDPNDRQSFGGESGTYNIVWDHNSAAWHTDDSMYAYQNTTHDMTFSNNLIAEGLPYDSSFQGSCGILAVGGSGSVSNISWLKNLCMHIPKENRNGPGTWHNTESVSVNNIFYNHGSLVGRGFLSESGNAPIGGTTYAALVGNWWIRGPNTAENVHAVYWYGTCQAAPAATFGLYMSDNQTEGSGYTAFTNCGGADPLVGSPPSQLDGLLDDVTVLDSGDVEAYLSANVGARPADRDSLDTRMITELAARSGSRKTLTTWGEGSPGTFPTLAENCIDHNVAVSDTGCANGEHQMPANPFNDADSDGYYDIEEWIHSWDCEVEGGMDCWAAAQPEPTVFRLRFR